MFHCGAMSCVRPFALVVPYHMAPSELLAGLVTVGSYTASLPFTSDQPVFASQRRPALIVRCGVSLMSSCTKTWGPFWRAPNSGVTLAFQPWVCPRRKSAYPRPEL